MKGFTLIELLVTIAIIGILASVVIMSLSEAIKKSETARDGSVSSSEYMELCNSDGCKMIK